MEIVESNKFILKIVNKDIMSVPARTIVNPLNTYLKLSIADGHVSSVINKLAGPELQIELDVIASNFNGHVPEGSVVSTGSYGLNKYGFQTVLHTVTKNPGEDYNFLRAAINDILSGTAMKIYPEPVVMPLICNHAGGVSAVQFARLLTEEMKKVGGLSQHLNVLYLAIPEKEKYEQVVKSLKEKRSLE